MPAKISALLPCVTFFSAGRIADGAANLLMQLSLVAWPLAVHWARQFNEQRYVNRMLNEFSAAYPLPLQSAKPGKRFRGAVPSNGIVFGKPQRNLRRAA